MFLGFTCLWTDLGGWLNTFISWDATWGRQGLWLRAAKLFESTAIQPFCYSLRVYPGDNPNRSAIHWWCRCCHFKVGARARVYECEWDKCHSMPKCISDIDMHTVAAPNNNVSKTELKLFVLLTPPPNGIAMHSSSQSFTLFNTHYVYYFYVHTCSR